MPVLKQMFPLLSTIVNHFKEKDKTKTKQACNEVTQFFFVSKASLLGAHSQRVFKRQAFYNESTSILIYHKLFHAWALKKLHTEHKGIAFLKGGLYHGCKDQPTDHPCHSIWLKTDGNNKQYSQVEEFSQFKLISNSVYLAPPSTSA